MAHMYPSTLNPETKSSAERRLYDALVGQLDDPWVVFHQVCWIGQDNAGRPSEGEADFVIAHPQRGVLVVEVKGGRIRFDQHAGCFFSRDGAGVEHNISDPFQQAGRSKHVLLNKMRAVRGWPSGRVIFGHAAAFPDAIADQGWIRPNAPRELLVDALDMTRLEERLIGALNFWRGQDGPPGSAGIDALVRTLAQADRIRNPLLAEHARADEQELVRLTQQQFRYLRFINGHRRAVIAGCAGSGKTLLAVEKARQLAAEGHKVLFTCYNRDLAEHVGITLGYRSLFDVFDFHQLCVRLAIQADLPGSAFDDSRPDFFTKALPEALMAAVDKRGAQYDAIIVDEGQDFRAEWWDALPWLLFEPADGMFYVFFDDNQRVYRDRSRIPIDEPPCVLDENCRNTQRIFAVVDRFYTGQQPTVVLGPEGQSVTVITYSRPRDAADALRRLLHRLLNEQGFRADEIAVLSALGAERSALPGQRLGNIQLTDRLPLAPGEVLATTVRRFKGLERPAIVLTDIDERLSPQDAETLMYVGTSRAKAYLALLVGENAPAAVREALQGLIDRA